MEQYLLSNGIAMPKIGYGSYHLWPWKTTKPLGWALDDGFRLVDTANIYLNERTIRKVLRKKALPRKELFIVSKIWPTYYEDEDCVERTLKRLGVDYLDCLLLHHPSGNYLAGYEKLERAYRKGLVHSIGLSNFFGRKLEEILSHATIKPQVIQMEGHPYCTQSQVRERLKEYGTVMMCYYPLGKGGSLFHERILQDIAKRHGKSIAQIILRWHLQMGFVPIPGSDNPDHLKSNLEVFDFQLTPEDMAQIRSLDGKMRFYNPTEKIEEKYVHQIPLLWK